MPGLLVCNTILFKRLKLEEYEVVHKDLSISSHAEEIQTVTNGGSSSPYETVFWKVVHQQCMHISVYHIQLFPRLVPIQGVTHYLV